MIIPDVKFLLKNKNDKNKPTLISAYFRYNKKRLVFSTKNKIEPKNWNFNKQAPHSFYPLYNQLKGELDQISDQIRDIYVSNPKIELDQFKNSLNNAINSDPSDDKSNFIDWCANWIKLREKLQDKDILTIKKYKTTLKKLQDYSDYKGTVLSFGDINKSFRDDFLAWLYDNTKVSSANTANKEFGVIKVFMGESYDDGMHENDYYRSKRFSVHREKTSIVALTEKELEQLYNYDLSDKKHLELIRDWFVVSCESSLRYSDLIRVNKNMVYFDEGDYYLKVYAAKTGSQVIIPASDRLMKILKKYEFKCPEFTDQYFNRQIKNICKVAGIDGVINIKKSVKGKVEIEPTPKYKKISSHVGRRTWASINYLRGYPIGLLMQVTGHQQESTFRLYIGVKKEMQAKELMRLMKGKAKVIDIAS